MDDGAALLVRVESAPLSEDVDEIGTRILDAAFRVHRALGPGLLESVYARCLTQALRHDGLQVRQEVWVPLEFEGVYLPQGLRIDLLVEEAVIVEVKAVECLHPVHEAQVLSQLRLGKKPLGYLLNFHVPRLQKGIRRFIMTIP